MAATGRVTIEVCGPKNENLQFAMAGDTLRGRWESHITAMNDKSDAGKAMATIRTIPGVHIWLDIGQRKAGVSDPLRETEEGRRIWAQIKSVMERYPHAYGGGQVPSVSNSSVVERILVENLTVDDIKDWAFHMRAAIDGNLAQYVPGSDQLPTADKIKAWPGKRKADPFNTGRMDQDLSPYTDVVEVPEAAKNGGRRAEPAPAAAA